MSTGQPNIGSPSLRLVSLVTLGSGVLTMLATMGWKTVDCLYSGPGSRSWTSFLYSVPLHTEHPVHLPGFIITACAGCYFFSIYQWGRWGLGNFSTALSSLPPTPPSNWARFEHRCGWFQTRTKQDTVSSFCVKSNKAWCYNRTSSSTSLWVLIFFWTMGDLNVSTASWAIDLFFHV